MSAAHLPFGHYCRRYEHKGCINTETYSRQFLSWKK